MADVTLRKVVKRYDDVEAVPVSILTSPTNDLSCWWTIGLRQVDDRCG